MDAIFAIPALLAYNSLDEKDLDDYPRKPANVKHTPY